MLFVIIIITKLLHFNHRNIINRSEILNQWQ